MTPHALHGSMLPLHTSLTVGQPALRRVSKHRATTTTATRAVAPGGGDRSKNSSSSSSSSVRRVECEVVRGKGLAEEEDAAASAVVQGRRALLASGLTLLAMAPTTANAAVDSAAPPSYGGPRPDESTSELMGEMAKLLKASREADESGEGGGDKESGLRNLGLLAIVGLILIPLVKVVLGGGLALSTLKYLQKEKRDQKCVRTSLRVDGFYRRVFTARRASAPKPAAPATLRDEQPGFGSRSRSRSVRSLFPVRRDLGGFGVGSLASWERPRGSTYARLDAVSPHHPLAPLSHSTHTRFRPEF